MHLLEYLALRRKKVLSSGVNIQLACYVLIAYLSIFTIIPSLTIMQSPDTICDRPLRNPPFIAGAVLLFFSIISLLSICFGVYKQLFRLLMMVIPLAIVMFLIIIVFGFVVTSGENVPWLRKTFIEDDIKWNTVKTCLIHQDVCKKVDTVYRTTPTFNEFRVMNWSAIQSGCCKPPDECNFTYVSPTEWTKPGGAGNLVVNSTNPDCKLWHNDDSALCFNCGSCKEGFIHKLKNGWRDKSYDNLMSLFMLVIFYCIGCACGYVVDLWP